MKLFATIVLSCSALIATAQNPNPIRVNQVGYYPTAEKTATIEKSGYAKSYEIKDKATGKTVWKGKALRTAVSPISGKERAIIDFSSITTPGEYIIKAGKYTQTFAVKDHAFAEVAKAGMKAFYLQRASVLILTEHAGEYARPMGHADTQVMVHPSAATNKRPAGTIINSAGGWYDAGDYNKYIVNSAFSIGLLLSAYEMNSAYFNAMDLNIPESKNNIPDFLDEIMVNLQWMLTMQDPDDGGVYHKMTTPNFEAFVMPTECHQQRYVVQKTTAAALDFAATMALASRIYKQYPEYKTWSEEALKKAEYAYEWAKKNPTVYYLQNEMNKQYEPAINTGAYDDNNVDDEFRWASIEIASANADITTLKDMKTTMQSLNPGQKLNLPVWGEVSMMPTYGMIGYLNMAGYLDLMKQRMGRMIDSHIYDFLGKYLAEVPTSCYNAPYGNSATDFQWGGNAEVCCGRGFAMLYAYRVTGLDKYLKGALEIADYLLGRNATGYCYVTGFGSFSPQHPHQRLSAADGIDAPLPGFLVGGPNPGKQDAEYCKSYTSDYADECYADDLGSYASNEIAINWNASLVAFLAWLDAEMK